ncbi:MAG: MFS transporter [Ilumatobacteraceae bacterium]
MAVAQEPAASAPIDGPPVTGSLAWATWALFVGLSTMLAGAGLFGTLVGVRGDLEGFPVSVIGLISASYYAGFLVGSRLALRALGQVGHIRVYAALASILAATILAVGLVVSPPAWVVMRFLTGLCLAGQYVVAESWLNQLTGNANRGRLLAVYGLVTTGAFGIGQLMFGRVDPSELTGFGIAAILICLAVAPVALSGDASPPAISVPARMTLRELVHVVPTGVGTSLLVGVAHGGFTGLSALYAVRAGLDGGEIARFVAAPMIGGLILQWPIAAASDDIDRRAVGVVAAALAAGGGVLLLVTGPEGWIGLALMAGIGGNSYPLYSIAGAYTNDWVPSSKITAAASQLVLLYGAGALIGPIVAALMMETIGVDGFVWTLIVIHAAIAAFLTHRFFAYRVPLVRRPWSDASLAARPFYIPVTVVSIGRRIRARPARRRK